jgi:DNA invertase Pin-like site-specific DNA recombinase
MTPTSKTTTSTRPSAAKTRKAKAQPAAAPSVTEAPAHKQLSNDTAPIVTGKASPRPGSKLAQVIGLLQREGGAALAELNSATGWLPHTTRAALTGLRKRGIVAPSGRTIPARRVIRCAIYTRRSSEEGLEQEFNSLQAQREACAAYITSQRHEGWQLSPVAYDDGGYSGGSMERPGLIRLMADVEAGRIDIVVVYKVDRLTRALTDFARIIEAFDQKGVSFVSVTQSFNTTSSMGRLTLNVLLSFAQFEREVTAERIRDKIAASKRKGLWMGGTVSFGDRVEDRKLVMVEEKAATVRMIFALYRELGAIPATVASQTGLRIASTSSRVTLSMGRSQISLQCVSTVWRHCQMCFALRYSFFHSSHISSAKGPNVVLLPYDRSFSAFGSRPAAIMFR